MIENGFVKFPRGIVQRKWFEDEKTLRLYLFLLCNAAFKDIERDGYTIHEGEYVTSARELAKRCQLTYQRTRTALKSLEATHDITIQTTSKYSIITLTAFTEQDGANAPDNARVNARVNAQINTRSRSKEEIKEEYKEEEAAPPAPTFANDDEQRAALEAKYGSEAVTKYEKKFLLWIQKKKLPNVPMYPTVAKWLAQDYGEYYQASPVEKPASNSSIDIDEFDAAVLKQYKRHKSVQD